MNMQRRSSEQIREHNRIAANRRRFAVKKHHASREHYDLRFWFNRSLVSLAMHDGPSCYAGVRRSAVRVPDHDCRYLISERVIPPKMRGAGPVLLWEEGFWIVLEGYEDVEACLWHGCLKFILEGYKLRGVWTLQRRPDSSTSLLGATWDLIKELDEFARDQRTPDVCVTDPYSVLSGKTIEELRQDEKKQVKRAMPLWLFI
jgi:bifunctional non-homologous end joining protein LigD